MPEKTGELHRVGIPRLTGRKNCEGEKRQRREGSCLRWQARLTEGQGKR